MSNFPRCGPPASRHLHCSERNEDQFESYEEIVADYLEHMAPIAKAERDSFRKMQTLEEAIKHAVLYGKINKHGKWVRHPHQCLIRRDALPKACKRLQAVATEIAACSSFAELYALVKREIDPIPGIADLPVYDIATRIGAYRALNLRPKLVYLHRGAAKGAKALGFTGKTLDPTCLPAAFHQLHPDDIESCLCCYKEELKQIRASMGKHKLLASH